MLAAAHDRNPAVDRAAPWIGSIRRKRLRAWARVNGRQFYWRQSVAPWELFVAEMLLRRTRAEQVAKHLPVILSEFPTPSHLARATWPRVERMFRPMGLTWRTRTLHQAAKKIISRHAGDLPLKEEELRALPGVGPYVAAITMAGIAGRPVVLTDTNSVRVACRVRGIPLTGDIRRRRDVQIAIHDLLGGPAKARDWWNVFDLAQQVCLPANPHCTACPIAVHCITGKVSA